MTTLRLVFHSDSGHGWLAVPLAAYRLSGFKASACSYYNARSKTVYLEEDSDAPEFKRRCEQGQLYKIEITDTLHEECSFIRDLYDNIPK